MRIVAQHTALTGLLGVNLTQVVAGVVIQGLEIVIVVLNRQLDPLPLAQVLKVQLLLHRDHPQVARRLDLLLQVVREEVHGEVVAQVVHLEALDLLLDHLVALVEEGDKIAIVAHGLCHTPVVRKAGVFHFGDVGEWFKPAACKAVIRRFKFYRLLKT